MRVRFASPNIVDRDKFAVLQSMEQREMTNAGNVRAFETAFRDFCGGGIAHATTNCMSALHLAAMAMIPAGSEVIVPALTHPATALAVTMVGAQCVFVDVDRQTGNMTPEAIKAAVTDNTSAIMVLHFLGRPAAMDDIMLVAREHDLVVIEDCALALGSFLDGKHVGLHGHAGCFSFYPAKHITTGEGGMILTRHPTVSEDVIMRRHFGQKHDRGLGIMTALPDWVTLGMNARMTEMQGALGVSQMGRLQDFLQIRRRNYNILAELLKDMDIMDVGGYSHYGFSVFVGPNRDKIAAKMKKKNVETSVYYKVPVPYTKFYGESSGYPVAEEISKHTICLPVGQHLTDKMVKYTAETLKECL